MKAKKTIIFLVLLTVLCGCTTQTSNNTDDMLETKTYLYSYDYETEPDGELSTAYHEEKPSVNQNESRDVVKATVNFRNKNAITYIKMNEKYSFGNCECSITDAIVTSNSNYFYTLVNEKYHTILSTGIYLLTLLTFPYFQGFPPLKILYMYPFPLFLPLWDNYKGKFIIQLFNRCLPLYQEVLRKSALLPL